MKISMAISMLVFCLFVACGILSHAAEKTDRDTILKEEKWQTVYDTFEVDDSMMEVLASKIGDNLVIDVYFAFWCHDSETNVPPFIKIIDQIKKLNSDDNSGENSDDNNAVALTVNYYSVKRKANKKIKYYVKDLKVERVPTFIFYRDGKEIGRIIENPKKSLTEDFLEIVF